MPPFNPITPQRASGKLCNGLDALHAVLCAAGFNIRWLLRALRRQLQAGGLKHAYLAWITVWTSSLAAAMAGLSSVLGATNADLSSQPLLHAS